MRSISNFQLEKIISGTVTCKFKLLGLGLIVTRLNATYLKAPSRQKMDECVAEIRAFIDKFAPVLEDDIEMISNL